MPFDEDDEETFIFKKDGITISGKGKGTNCLRMMIPNTSSNGSSEFQAVIADRNKNVKGLVEDLIGSHVGRLFDEYVRQVLKEPAAYSSAGPASKEYPHLWPGRRLKLLLAKDSPRWVQAKVVRFSQWCAGPYSPSTLWYMTVRFNDDDDSSLGPDGNNNSSSNNNNDEPDLDFQEGQLVELHSLKAKQHNGKYGVVMACKNDQGRYAVKIKKASSTMGIQPANLKAVRELKYEIGRANIHGGGTLIGDPSRDLADKISFEWVDPPSPTWEPKMCTLEDDLYQLQVEFNPAELKAKRQILLEEFSERTPSYLGAPDCDSRTCAPIQTPKRQAFDHYMNTIFGPILIELVKASDWEGLEEVLMTQPLLLWNNEHLWRALKEVRSNKQASKIVIAVLHERHKTMDFVEMNHWMWNHERRVPKDFANFADAQERCDHDRMYHIWVNNYASAIGMCYENETKDYPKALPWHLHALEFAQRADQSLVLCHVYRDLALTYENMGYLGRAYEMYRQGVWISQEILDDDSGIKQDFEKLKKELRLWTGTSSWFVAEDDSLRIDGDGIESYSIRPHASMPSHYGDYTGRLQWTTVPVELPRTLSLAPLPPTLSAVGTTSGDAGRIFMEIFDGDFIVKVVVGDGATFGVDATTTPGTSQVVLSLLVYSLTTNKRVFLAAYVFNKRGGRIIVVTTYLFDEPYKSWYTQNQKTALCQRVCHWVVRAKGARIVELCPTSCQRPLFNYLREAYQKPNIKNWKDALDMSVVEADLLAKDPDKRKEAILSCLNWIGESLESLGKFKRAAKVYSGASAYALQQGTYIEARTLSMNAGLAYRRCSEFAQGEREFIASLHFHYKAMNNTLDMNDDFFDDLITNVMVNYDMWAAQSSASSVEEVLTSMGGTSEEYSTFIVFSCLLFGAGFKARQGGIVGRAVNVDGRKSQLTVLKQEFQRASRRCKDALIRAVKDSPDVSVFRAKILDCKRPSCISAMIRDRDSRNAQEKDVRKESKKSAREFSTTSKYYEMCHNTDCSTLMMVDKVTPQCVCGKVLYCSSECKAAHSPEHKKVCSKACSQCFKGEEEVGKHLVCPCQAVQYCSKECQKLAWRQHKQVCATKKK